MDGARLVRLRWRLRGAWLWPSYVILTPLDAVIGHLLPPLGESQSSGSAWLVALFLNLIAVGVLAPVFGMLLRRRRPDLPRIVARDYAGTWSLALITAGLLVTGLAHHGSVVNDHQAEADALARAEAFIGVHAPPVYRTNLGDSSTYEIQPGRIFRTCVRNPSHTSTYCVVVDVTRPFGRSVRRDGHEPNAVMFAGTS